jgi:prophage regulatory protein
VRILRMPAVEAKTGLKKSAIYERIANRTFPGPIPLDGQAKGFIEHEIDDWIRAQIAERDAGAANKSFVPRLLQEIAAAEDVAEVAAIVQRHREQIEALPALQREQANELVEDAIRTKS